MFITEVLANKYPTMCCPRVDEAHEQELARLL